MLRKFKICVVLLSFVGFNSLAQSFAPSQAQIQQLKNMPRAQQEALARQLGIDVSSFRSSNFGSQSSEQANSGATELVEREVDQEAIAKRLAEQSVAQESSAQLKPFGYDLFASSGDEGERVSFAPANNTPVPYDYVMGPGDSVSLQLYGKQTGNYELFVNAEGAIQVPELGPMSVVGMTYQEFKQQLAEKYNKQVIGVTPHITMGALRTIQIFIVGEAFRPGTYTLSSLSTVTHALFASGGVSDIGSLRNIEVKRAGKTVVTFDLYDLLVFGDTSKDIRLTQGDVVFIPTVQKVVSIDGKVRRPAIYEVKSDEGLSQALSIAGGVLPSGASHLVQIARNASKRGLEVQTIDVAKNAYLELANGDYISVPGAHSEFSNAVVIVGAHTNPGLTQWQQNLTLSQLITKHTLLSSTDLDYGLIVRKPKFSDKSQVIQFRPRDIIDGSLDIPLSIYDQITLFNRFGADDADSLEEDVVDGELKASQDDLKNEAADYLQEVEAGAFTEKQLFLNETQSFSRKKLLAPIIAKLKDEGTQADPVALVEVTGQVKYPGVYPLPHNGKIADILFASGGLLESAYLEHAELSRNSLDANNALATEHISIDLARALASDSEANMSLTSKDTLNVLRTPDWYDNRTIELLGEVVFPGTYQIKKNETLAQIIARAGGLTPDASISAAIFTREELKERERLNLDKTVEELRQQIISSNVSGSQNVKAVDYSEASAILDELLSVEPIGRLVIDLDSVLSNKSKDLTLKSGDKLYIPNISRSVSVIGEVFVPATHILNDIASLDDYIEQSGGLTERADGSKVYVVKADGSVKLPSKNFWFSDKKLMLEPGDTIVVPRDVVNYERLGLWQTVTQIIYNSAVAVIAIGSI